MLCVQDLLTCINFQTILFKVFLKEIIYLTYLICEWFRRPGSRPVVEGLFSEEILRPAHISRSTSLGFLKAWRLASFTENKKYNSWKYHLLVLHNNLSHLTKVRKKLDCHLMLNAKQGSNLWYFYMSLVWTATGDQTQVCSLYL